MEDTNRRIKTVETGRRSCYQTDDAAQTCSMFDEMEKLHSKETRGQTNSENMAGTS